MALTTTTLSSAVTVNDRSIVVASATGFVAGSLIRMDGEFSQVANSYVSGTTIPILRGVGGTATQAHAASANVTVGTAADFAGAAPQSPVAYPVATRAREVKSYSAAGAIGLPTPGNDMVAIINGTGALAMTLANPTKDMDGDILTIIGNGKAAHTVTYTAGFGNAGGSYDLFTFAAGGQNVVQVMAANGFWVTTLIGGTATAITATIA